MSADPPEAIAACALHVAHEDPDALTRRLEALHQERAALRTRLRRVHGAILLLGTARELVKDCTKGRSRPCER